MIEKEYKKRVLDFLDEIDPLYKKMELVIKKYHDVIDCIFIKIKGFKETESIDAKDLKLWSDRDGR